MKDGTEGRGTGQKGEGRDRKKDEGWDRRVRDGTEG